MWNFAGKQNDVQGVGIGNPRDGNWLTGIGFYDNIRLGDQNKIPDSMKNNRANNKLYMLPFILGLLGLIYQYNKDKKDALVSGLLFFFTGIAICLYLNQAGNQPAGTATGDLGGMGLRGSDVDSFEPTDVGAENAGDEGLDDLPTDGGDAAGGDTGVPDDAI